MTKTRGDGTLFIRYRTTELRNTSWNSVDRSHHRSIGVRVDCKYMPSDWAERVWYYLVVTRDIMDPS